MTASSAGAPGGGGRGAFSVADLERLLDAKLSGFETRLAGLEKTQQKILQVQSDDGKKTLQLLTTQFNELRSNGSSSVGGGFFSKVKAPPMIGASASPATSVLTRETLDALLESREKTLINHLRETERQINDHISLSWDHKEITTKVSKMDQRLEVIMSGEGEASALMEKMLPALDTISERSLAIEKSLGSFQDLGKKVCDTKDYTKDCLDVCEEMAKSVKSLEKHQMEVPKIFRDNKQDVYDTFCNVIEQKIGRELASAKKEKRKRHRSPSQPAESSAASPLPPMVVAPAPDMRSRTPSHEKQTTPSNAEKDSGRASGSPAPAPAVPTVPLPLPVSLPPGPSIPNLLASELEDLASGVAEIQEKMDSWLKYSKKTLHKSDDNTESMMTKLTLIGTVLANFKDEMRKEMEALKKAKEEETMEEETKDEKPEIEQVLAVKETGKSEEKKKKMSEEIKALVDASSAAQNEKLEELLNRVKATEKAIRNHTASYQDNSLKMLKLVKDTETVTKGIAATQSKQPASNDNTIKAKAETTLEEIRQEVSKLSAVKVEGSAGKSASEEEKFQLQRIADIVVDVRDLLTKPQPEDGSGSGGQLGQLRKLLLEVKEGCEMHQQGELKFLGELKNESTKVGKALDVMAAKAKANEKICGKTFHAVESIVKNSTSDAKTLSQMNTTIQGLKAGENKHKDMLKSLEAVKQTLEKVKSGDLQEIKTQLDALSMMRVEDGKAKPEEDVVAKLGKTLAALEKKLSEQAKLISTEVKKNLMEQISVCQQKICDQSSKERRAAATEVKKCVVDYALQTQQKVHEVTDKQNSKIAEGLTMVQSGVSDQSTKQHKEMKKMVSEFSSDVKKSVSEISTELKKSVNSTPGRKRSLRKNVAAADGDEVDDSISTNTTVAVLEDGLSKIVSEVAKHKAVSTEIFNSIEDMKQLHSSMPNTLHDEVIPAVEKLLKGMAEVPTEAFMAVLEENLCKNMRIEMEMAHQATQQELFQKFEGMETRLAVIKKYAKYGSASADRLSTSGTAANTTPGTPKAETVPQPNANAKASNSSLDPATISQLMQHISQQCSDLSSSLDFTDTLANLDTQLKELLEVDKKILHDQARGAVVEELLEAATHTVIQDLKPDLAVILNEVKELAEQPLGQKEGKGAKNASLTPAIKRMQAEILKKLDESTKEQESRLSLLLEEKGPSICGDDESSSAGIDSVKKLLSYLHRVQTSQREILDKTNQTIDIQTDLNHTFKGLVQMLEKIQSIIKTNDNTAFGALPELCHNLQQRVKSLESLESKVSDPRTQGCKDLREIVQKAMMLLDKMLKAQAGYLAGIAKRHQEEDPAAAAEKVVSMEESEQQQEVEVLASPVVLAIKPQAATSAAATPKLGNSSASSSSSATAAATTKKNKRKSDNPTHVTPSGTSTVTMGGRTSGRMAPKRSKVDYREADSDELDDDDEFDILPDPAAVLVGRNEEDTDPEEVLEEESDGGEGVQEVDAYFTGSSKYQTTPAEDSSSKPAQVRIKSVPKNSTTGTAKNVTPGSVLVYDENPLVEEVEVPPQEQEQQQQHQQPSSSSTSFVSRGGGHGGKRGRPGPASMTGKARGVPETGGSAKKAKTPRGGGKKSI